MGCTRLLATDPVVTLAGFAAVVGGGMAHFALAIDEADGGGLFDCGTAGAAVDGFVADITFLGIGVGRVGGAF